MIAIVYYKTSSLITQHVLMTDVGGDHTVTGLVPKKGATAYVWNFFGLKDGEKEKDRAITDFCSCLRW